MALYYPPAFYNATGNTSGATSSGPGSLVLAGGPNVTLSGATNQGVMTLSISVGNPGSTGITALSGGTQLATSASILFADSNGVSWGVSGSSRFTASFDGIRSISGGTQTLTGSAISFQDSNGISFGVAGSRSLTMSMDAVRSVVAGTATATGSLVSFANSNGISFGANGATITARMPSISFFEPHPLDAVGTPPNGTLMFQRLFVPYQISATRLDVLMHITGSASAAASFSFYAGIYTMSGSTGSRASSGSRGITFQSTSAQSYTNHSGTRYHSLNIGTWNITPGDYLVGLGFASTSASTNCTITLYVNRSSVSIIAASTAGGNFSQYFNHGVYSAATSSAPTSVHLSDIIQTGVVALRQPWFNLAGTF